MAVAIRAEVQGAAELARRLSGLPAAIRAAERRGVTKAGLIVEREARRKFVGYGQGRSDSLQTRTGNLRRSLNTSVETGQDGPEARVGYRRGEVDRYAETVELGRTIRPRSAKWLTIPVGEALSPSGVPRYSGPLDPRLTSKDTKWIPRKGKPPIFVEINENDEIENVLFVGRKEVKIVGRKYLSRSLNEKRPEVLAAIRDEVEIAARAVAGG